MSQIHVVAEVKRVGNSLAFFIPAADARRAGIQEGQTVEASITSDVPSPFGLLKDLPYEPFVREKDRRDRL